MAAIALDSLLTQVAVLDAEGNVVAVNKTWRDFSKAAAHTDRALPGENYFEHCRKSGAASSHLAELEDGVRAVLQTRQREFLLEYPCATKGGERWFRARVTSSGSADRTRIIIAHDDISDAVDSERSVVEAIERERQRFRKDMHDGLSQHLTGLKFKTSLLEYHLQSKNLAEASEARALTESLNAATEEASQLMGRLRPTEIEPRTLMMALRELAANAERQHDVKCVARIARPVFVDDARVATNLFRLAAEAMESAAAQGGARRIQLLLSENETFVTLTIRDDGKPVAERPDASKRIVRHHARVLGGLLEWRSKSPRGVVLNCRIRKRARSTV